MKFISFYKGSPVFSTAEFQGWFYSEHSAAILRFAPRLRKLIVNLVDVPGSRLNKRVMPGFQNAPAYDVVAEMFFDEREHFVNPAKRFESAVKSGQMEQDLDCRIERIASYRVTEWVEKDQSVGCQTGRTCGVKSISIIAFRSGLSDLDCVAWWDAHVQGTCESLPGLTKYRRNWVDEIMTAGAPPIKAIGELQYETLFHEEHIPLQEDIVRGLDIENTIQLDCSEYIMRS